MQDIQNLLDTRSLPLSATGIRALRLPIRLLVQDGGVQHTVAEFCCSTDLSASQRGTHMSRLVIGLHDLSHNLIDLTSLTLAAQKIQRSLTTNNVTIEVCFPFFLTKQAPVSRLSGITDYDVTLLCRIENETARHHLQLKVPVMLLCPCSKAISKHNAHNQRSIVTLSCELDEWVQIESLIAMIEKEASVPVFSVLKRPDEKYVTEQSYENPKFVEDIVRDIAISLRQFHAISKYAIDCRSIESIHNHDAYAQIEGVRE